jgi:hypothetical protein
MSTSTAFQHDKSKFHNLTHLTNHIHFALNDKKYCIGLFLDFAKHLTYAHTQFY